MYLPWNLPFFKWVRPKDSNLEPVMAQQTRMSYYGNVLLSYVNETIYLLGNLPLRFISIVLRRGMTHLVPMLSQNTCCGKGA